MALRLTEDSGGGYTVLKMYSKTIISDLKVDKKQLEVNQELEGRLLTGQFGGHGPALH